MVREGTSELDGLRVVGNWQDGGVGVKRAVSPSLIECSPPSLVISVRAVEADTVLSVHPARIFKTNSPDSQST